MENSSRKQNYRIGDSVEVNSKEEGFVGSYYVAKVLQVSKDHIWVEYKTLVTDDESKWLKERVHVSEVRPRPPQLHASSFNVSDKVDAYDNDGWWAGRIFSIDQSKYYACFDHKRSSEDDGDEVCNVQKRRRLVDESKYHVYFPTTQQLVAYTFSALRPHQEWKNGKWVLSCSWL